MILERSGRTSRMMAEAKAVAHRERRAVYVIAASHDHARALEDEECRALGIKVEYPAPDNFDWQTMTLRGAHPNCVVFVDHHAIERRFARVLDMLHRFDPVKES